MALRPADNAEMKAQFPQTGESLSLSRTWHLLKAVSAGRRAQEASVHGSHHHQVRLQCAGKTSPRSAPAGRNNFLLLGHMQRLHHLMSDDLRADLDEMLRQPGELSHSSLYFVVVLFGSGR